MLQKIHPVLVLPSATGCHFQVMFTQFGENANKQQKLMLMLMLMLQGFMLNR